MKTKSIIGKIRMADGVDINNGGVFFNGEMLLQCDVNNDLDILVFKESAFKFKSMLTFSEAECLKRAEKYEIKKEGNVISLKMKYLRDNEPIIKEICFVVFGNKFTML